MPYNAICNLYVRERRITLVVSHFSYKHSHTARTVTISRYRKAIEYYVAGSDIDNQSSVMGGRCGGLCRIRRPCIRNIAETGYAPASGVLAVLYALDRDRFG